MWTGTGRRLQFLHLTGLISRVFCSRQMTWADLAFLQTVGWIVLAGGDSELAKFPKLVALKERVEKLPKIAEWIAKRPASDF